MFAMSPPDMPIQSVAHSSALCLVAIGQAADAVDLARAAEQAVAVERDRPGVAELTDRGMLQM